MTTTTSLYQQLKNCKIIPSARSGPLELWLLEADPAFDTPDLMLLDEALDKGILIVHETGNVQQLTIENLSTEMFVFIQAGEIVKGGKQDRTIQIDLVVPPRSGVMPLPSFCVEHARWHARRGDQVHQFAASKVMSSGKALRTAIRKSKNQGEVWSSVAESQETLSKSIQSPVCCAPSPSSYHLSLHHEALQKARQALRPAIREAFGKSDKALGFVFAVNGKIQGAECFSSYRLFNQSWAKWEQVILDEAIMGAARADGVAAVSDNEVPSHAKPIDPHEVADWLKSQTTLPTVEDREVPPATRLLVREKAGKTTLHTYWKRDGVETALHDSWLPE